MAALQPLHRKERIVTRADDGRLGQRCEPVRGKVLRNLVDVDDLLALGLDHDDRFRLVEGRDAADIERGKQGAEGADRGDHHLAPPQGGRDSAQVERLVLDGRELRRRRAEGLHIRRQLRGGAHALLG
jgi:hypothetical protein